MLDQYRRESLKSFFSVPFFEQRVRSGKVFFYRALVHRSSDQLSTITGDKSALHSKPLVRENQKFGPCRFWLAHSLNTLMGKAIASGPKGTLRARRALWVVHTFFVRASDNPLSYDSGARCVRLEEG